MFASGASAGAAPWQDLPPSGSEPPPAPKLEPDVLAIEVQGLQRVPESVAVAALGQTIGEPLDKEALTRGVRRLWDTRRIQVTVNYRDVEGGIELVVLAIEMPVDLEPRFVGHEEFSLATILEWARLDPGEELYANEAQRVRRRLIDNYRRNGFHFVEVVVVERPATADAPPDVIFEIREGPAVHVWDVVIRGNESLPERGIWPWKSGLVEYANPELGSPFLGFLFKDDFVEETLDADVLAMRQVYRERGWLDAVVDVHRLEFDDDREWVTIHIAIDEGEPYTMGSLGVEAVRLVPAPDERAAPVEEPAELLFPEQELLELLELQPGVQYDEIRLRRDRRALLDYYGERGYLAHSSLNDAERWQFLDPVRVYDYENKRVHLTYRIAQGQQQRIREIRFQGTAHTEDRVVRRQLTVFPGQVADLGQIQRSLSRLRGLGYFTDPFNRLDHPEPTFRFVDTGEPGWKDLEYVVEEGQVLQFNVSGGAGSNLGLFGTVSLTMANFDLFSPPTSFWNMFEEVGRKEAFHGAGQRLELIFSPGTELTRGRLRFQEPDLFGTHRDRISFDFTLEQSFRIYETHDERRRSAQVRFGRQVTADSSVFVGFGLGDVRVDDIETGGEPSLIDPPAVPDQLLAQEGSNNLNLVEIGYSWRELDSFLFPREGHTLFAGVEVYDDAWGSDFEFASATVRGEYYGLTSLEREGVRTGYKLELGLGVSQPFGDTDDVPYTERSFLGGSGTLRGFDFRGVGPNRDGFPIGGETYLNGSIEYRIPLLTNVPAGSVDPIEAVRGLLFLDWGVLDPEPFTLDVDELRASIGFGIGLTVPVPITLTFGFPIREGDGDDTRVINFSIGL